MGVRGLLSFINSRHEEYFTPINISDCNVIVDGNNLRYCLYNTCPVRNSCFGGDYQKYYLNVKAYFQRLLDCNVNPIVLMDGSFEVAKKPTLYTRAKDQARTSTSCSPSTHHKNIVLPMFAKEVFLQAIRDLGIKIKQTLSEADADIARLGFKTSKSETSRSCYVVSNDTDFCIYDVNVISLDSTLSAGDAFVHNSTEIRRIKIYGILYKNQKNIGPEKSGLLHLMATLCGNDYVGKNGGALDRIFGQVPKVPKGCRKSMNPRHQRMFALLTWLAREVNTEKALERLLEAVPLDKRDQLRQKLQLSIDIYSLDKEDIEEFTTAGGKPLNETFLRLYEDAHFPHWVLDVAKHRLCFLPNQVEDKSKISSHQFASKIFEKICQIMIAEDLQALETSEDSIQVQMIARGKISTTTRRFYFQKDDQSYGFNQIQNMNEDQRRDIFLDCLNISDRSEQSLLSEKIELAVIFFCIHYWLTKSCESQEAVSLTELSAVALSLAIWQSSAEETNSAFREKIRELGRMNRDPKHSFDISVVHTLANFQSVLYHSSVLNRLLANPFPDPMSMNTWWNGTLIYNFVTMFKDESEFRSKLLTLDETLSKKFDEIQRIIRSGIPAANRLRLSLNIKSGRNRKRNRERVERKEESDCAESSSEDSEEEGEGNEKSEMFCDLNNRFALLLT